MMFQHLKNLLAGERLPLPGLVNSQRVKGPPQSMTLICKLSSLQPYILYMAHTPQKAIVTFLNYPSTKYQPITPVLEPTEIIQTNQSKPFTLPYLAFLTEAPVQARPPITCALSGSSQCWCFPIWPCMVCCAYFQDLSITHFVFLSLFALLWPHLTDHHLKEHRRSLNSVKVENQRQRKS